MKQMGRKKLKVFTIDNFIYGVIFLCVLLLVAGVPDPRGLDAASAAEIDREVDDALKHLFADSSEAKELSKRAKGILVFPDVVKAGLIIGGQYGAGAMRVKGKTVAYYNTVAASYGLQAGAQEFGYAMFFMNQSAMDYLKESSGWEVGTGPSIVVVDKGAAGGITTTSGKEDVYAFFFDQKGLMAGLGLQGAKISRIKPE
jgi:lipid-binding SYLF domain-containing protein